MMRSMLLVTVFLALAYVHHSKGHGGHDHDDLVSVSSFSADSGDLTIIFHAPENEDFDQVKFVINEDTSDSLSGTENSGTSHDGHTDWEHTFASTSFDECETIQITVYGINDNVSVEEADLNEDLPGDCD